MTKLSGGEGASWNRGAKTLKRASGDGLVLSEPKFGEGRAGRKEIKERDFRRSASAPKSGEGVSLKEPQMRGDEDLFQEDTTTWPKPFEREVQT